MAYKMLPVMNLTCPDCDIRAIKCNYWVFSPAKVISAGVGVILLVCILPNAFARIVFHADISQAAKYVRAANSAGSKTLLSTSSDT